MMRKWNLIFFLFFLVLVSSGHDALARTHKKTHVTPSKQHHAQKKPRTHTTKKTHVTQHKKKPTLKRKLARHNLPSHGSNLSAIHANSNLPQYLFSESEQSLVDFVHNMVSGLHYSTYRLGGTYINSTKGEYVVDCSTYVDHVLKSVYPTAYQRLARYSQSQKPTSDDFYHYFTEISNREADGWNTIHDVSELRPGDILVFRYTNRLGDETGGHVMIVMDRPRAKDNMYSVRVADSASDGHSQDTRRPHSSGVGIGTLLLKTDHTQMPRAFAWKAGSRWQSNVAFAMGRPREHA